MNIFPMLNFGGNCAEAFRFYEEHLGGKITATMRASEAPGGPKAVEGAQDPIIYARMTVDDAVLIGMDVPGGHFEPMRSSYLYFTVDSTEEAERLYGVLSEGGEVFMPLAETFFAFRFAMLRDRFGVLWALIHSREMA